MAFAPLKRSSLDFALTDQEIMEVAPSVFATQPHESRSDRYAYIPTIDVLNGLRKEGFQPFFAAQSRTNVEGKELFTKHLIRLRKDNTSGIQKAETHEILLVNSHDGTSSYQMMAGMFRFVCTNGLVTGDIVEDIRVQHRGDVVNNVIEAAYEIINETERIEQNVEQMKSIELRTDEAEIFAQASLALKYDDNAPLEARNLLQPRRWEDKDQSLWTQFNVVQENLVKGGQRGRTATGRRTSTRPVKSIDNNVKLNKALWILADEMAKLKS